MRMGEFIIQRLWAMVFQVLGAVALIFVIVGLLPYDPTLIFLFNFRGTEEERAAALAELRQSLGLDVPIYQRYLNFFRDIFVEGSLGTSWSSGVPITQLYADAMFLTFLTFGIAFLIYTPLSILFGILAAYYKNSKFDYFMRVITTVIYSIPPVVLGFLIIIWIIDMRWTFAPIPPGFYVNTIADFKFLLVPILLTILIYTGFQFRLIRIFMLNILNQNYIRTARSKGLSERQVIFKHALRNALPQFFNTIAVTFPIAFTGIAGLEIVFGIRGGGTLLVNAALQFDWPVLIAGTAIYTTVNAIVLTITDMLIYAVSPRQRFSIFSQ
ncbi:MAG: ABC transporter permease [Candidatus Heimdallarchaeota archaeon]|nr:ABC transporter permease [Candidatus Heimdallarchaeota archaeon]